MYSTNLKKNPGYVLHAPGSKGILHKGASLGNGRRILVFAKSKLLQKMEELASQSVIVPVESKAAVTPKFVKVRKSEPKRGTPEHVAWQKREHDAYLARVARRAKAKALTPVELAHRQAALAAFRAAA